MLGKLTVSSLGFRDKKAEQASDLASDLPGHCPDYMPAHEGTSKMRGNTDEIGS